MARLPLSPFDDEVWKIGEPEPENLIEDRLSNVMTDEDINRVEVAVEALVIQRDRNTREHRKTKAEHNLDFVFGIMSGVSVITGLMAAGLALTGQAHSAVFFLGAAVAAFIAVIASQL